MRDAIDLAKRVLTKEKLDRQLTGQSSTPFIKATSNNDCHSPQNQQKKGITFDAMEMLERNSDCIDRLTSLVSDLKMTMDRKPQYKPKIYQGRSRNQNAGLQNFTPRNRSFSRGRNQDNPNNYRQTIEIDQEVGGTTTGQVIGVVITQITTEVVIQDRTIDKTHNGHLETEVKVEVEMKIMVTINLEVEVEIEIKGDEKNLGLDPIQGKVQIEIACIAIDAENMIILHLSALIPRLMKRQIVRMQTQHLCR